MLEWREGEARQRRESGVLEEGRRREEELAARLQAVLQDSQVRSRHGKSKKVPSIFR